MKNTIHTLALAGALALSTSTHALSPEAEEGKLLYPTCHVCHNPDMDPPLGPPMWGVQRRYMNNSLDKEDFVKSMASFVKAPSLETAIHDQAVEQLGLMPPLPLPDAMLEKIAAYIYEEQYDPPCGHWRIAVKRALARGDTEHADRDAGMIERFCK